VLGAPILGALDCADPVLVRVAVDYGSRPIRWLHAARQRFMAELSREERLRFIARAGIRALDRNPLND
jgi:hypothetical protein